MENEWKELKMYRIPSDLSKYEFYSLSDGKLEKLPTYRVIYCLLRGYTVYHRLLEPTPTEWTHEEIMTKWVKVKDPYGNNPKWERVSRYRNGVYYFAHNDKSSHKSDFVGKILVDLPPEE